MLIASPTYNIHQKLIYSELISTILAVTWFDVTVAKLNFFCGGWSR
jgi:hypothetical protein